MREQGRHYERAFEEYLRAHRIPYVAVDEARRALAPLGVNAAGDADLKSFDFAIFSGGGGGGVGGRGGEGGTNLLIDIKGRRAAGVGRTSGLQSWVSEDDVRSLLRWERLFGGGPAGAFRAAFVFVYWCDEQPPDALFQEVFEERGRWYAMRAVAVADYAAAMRPRSERWRTVYVPAREFERLSHPLTPAMLGSAASDGGGEWGAPVASTPITSARDPACRPASW